MRKSTVIRIVRVVAFAITFIYAIWQTMLSLWQIEICYIYLQIGWETDIAGMIMPGWKVVQFYMDKIIFAWCLTIVVVFIGLLFDLVIDS